MNERHIVKAYDEDLNQLYQIVSEMGGLVEDQLATALDALVRHDPTLANEVIERDRLIDVCEVRIDRQATELLALRAPMAEDLRIVLAALKLASNLERIGDYTKNIARRTVTLTKVPLLAPATQSLRHMGQIVQDMIGDALDAYANRDADLARAVLLRDQDVDRLNTSLFKEFLELMAAEPHHITACTHLSFIVRDVERIGDHAANVANRVIYMLEGYNAQVTRPKDDRSSTIVLEVGESKN
ncbi:MAG: phosphate signaling complex protein PhoU [Alphaproteobacteria bacterium]|nr:MAG: phosphate signaling complex protein PhoU [Alphaproteobacteria bacterium]